MYLKSMCETDHVNVLHIASVHAASSPEPSSTLWLRLSRVHILDPLFVLQLHGRLSDALDAREQAVEHRQAATNCSESKGREGEQHETPLCITLVNSNEAAAKAGKKKALGINSFQGCFIHNGESMHPCTCMRSSQHLEHFQGHRLVV